MSDEISNEFASPSENAPKPGSNRQNHDRRPPSSSQPPHRPQRGNSPELTPATLKQDPRLAPRFNRRNQPEREPPKHPDGRLIRQPFNGEAHLYEVIQARLTRTQRLIEVNTNGLHLNAGESVLVRVHRNILLAVTVGVRYRRVAEINSMPFVIRIASQEDRDIDRENAVIEKHAQELASAYAIEQNLQMKVLSADLSHDHKNITINFASDVRVDFRDMVAYLAGQLKLRVEMYQLGLRNGTGIICGLGACGQLLCCGRFLGQFDPIAVKQLRAQGLATNPKRISGVCGRLYCCMSYEYCDYMRERRNLPKKGRKIFSRWGIGRVSEIDMLREEVVVAYENGEIGRLTPHDFIPATDEIQAKVDAGEIEFPLEPAKFFLNRDPSAAVEQELQTKTQKASSLRQSSPKHVVRIKRRITADTPEVSVTQSETHATPAASAPQPAAPGRNADAPAQTRRPDNPVPTKDRPMHQRHRPPISKHRPTSQEPVRHRPPSTADAPRQAAYTAPTQPPASSRTASAPVQSSAPENPPQNIQRRPDPAPIPPRHDGNHVTRVPRKVKAHQANLEDAMNSSADNRHDPLKPSRRRYSPLSPTPLGE